MKTFLRSIKAMDTIAKTIMGTVVVIALWFMVSDIKTKSDLAVWKQGYNAYRDTATMTIQFAENQKKLALALIGDTARLSAKVSGLEKDIVVLKSRTEQSKTNSTRLETEIGILKQNPDSVAMARTVIPKQDSVISEQKIQIADKDTIIAKKDTIIAQKDSSKAKVDSANTKLLFVVDTLTKRLKLLPVAPKDPDKVWGFIPKPGRKTVAGISFVLGMIAENQLAKARK